MGDFTFFSLKISDFMVWPMVDGSRYLAVAGQFHDNSLDELTIPFTKQACPEHTQAHTGTHTHIHLHMIIITNI